MTYSLTKKQLKVYKFISECLVDKEDSPTLQEIADEFDFSNPSTAQYFVDTLIEKRWLSREKNRQLKLGGEL